MSRQESPRSENVSPEEVEIAILEYEVSMILEAAFPSHPSEPVDYYAALNLRAEKPYTSEQIEQAWQAAVQFVERMLTLSLTQPDLIPETCRLTEDQALKIASFLLQAKQTLSLPGLKKKYDQERQRYFAAKDPNVFFLEQQLKTQKEQKAALDQLLLELWKVSPLWADRFHTARAIYQVLSQLTHQGEYSIPIRNVHNHTQQNKNIATQVAREFTQLINSPRFQKSGISATVVELNGFIQLRIIVSDKFWLGVSV
jgi:hypothetical protein